LGGINPQVYLTDVFTRIVLRGDADPIDDLLPYNWVDSRVTASAIIEQAAQRLPMGVILALTPASANGSIRTSRWR
jgi:hypothetical protein